jgi:hypothetical protein
MTRDQIIAVKDRFSPDMSDVHQLVEYALRAQERLRILEAEMDLSSRLKVILDSSDRHVHLMDGAKKLRDEILRSLPDIAPSVDLALEKCMVSQ